jgi:hypothetical protein
MVNDYSKYFDYGDSLHFYIFELANFSFIAFCILLAYQFKWLSPISMWAWLLLAFVPLLTNYFLFSPYLFGDQFVYFDEITSLKATGQSAEYIQVTSEMKGGTISDVTIASKIIGMVPIPAYMTVTSIAYANKFISFVLFLWLTRFFDQEKLLVFFLVPSFVLYASIGLRDMLVIAMSVLCVLYLARGRYIYGIIFLISLYFLKIQMFAFLSIYLIGRIVFRAHKSFKGMLLMLASGLVVVFIFQELFLLWINYFKVGFAAENIVGGYQEWNRSGDASLFQIDSIFGFLWRGLIKFPIFMLMPLPWQWSNPLHILQFVETIGLLLGLFYVLKHYYKAHDQEIIFLIVALFIGLFTYSFLSENIGTFVRYRFGLYLPFLISIYYIAKRNYISSSIVRR